MTITSSAHQRLDDLGHQLPAPAVAAAYEGAIRWGDTLITSGQLPLRDGALVATGSVGGDVGLEAAQEAARHCALNVLAQAHQATGDLDAIARLQKITVFVASAPGFTDQHLVANAASELLVQVLGQAGRHARSAIGVASLPMNAAVEVEATFQLVAR